MDGVDGPQQTTSSFRFRHAAVALLLFGASLIILTATLDDPGLTWDEPAYLHSARGDIRRDRPPTDAADAYHRQCGVLPWLRRIAAADNYDDLRRQFSRKAVLRAWDYNRYGPNFHPPFSGELAILGHLLTRSWLEEVPSWRFASAFELSVTVALAYAVLASIAGFWPGLMAAGALFLIPRVFGHGHIFGTDIPTLFIWVIAAVLFWYGLRSRLARLCFGASCGLAFITKMNACAVVLPIALWSTACVVRGLARKERRAWLALVFLVAAVLPLAFAFQEVRRQGQAIRLQTQRELVLRAAVRAGLSNMVSETALQSERELNRAAARLIAALAERSGIGISSGQLENPQRRAEIAQALGFPELNLNSYLAYVWPDQLNFPSQLPRFVLFLPCVPLAIWLVIAGRVQNEATAALEMMLAACALGPVFAIALNPTWWFDTYTQLAVYYLVSVGRQGALPEIEIFYLGQKYVYSLPWHNGFVLPAVTVPVTTLLWFLVGSTAAIYHREWRRFARYLLLHALTLPVLRILPVPAHDGVRLMLPTFWFLAVLAGVGLALFCTLLRRFGARGFRFHVAAFLVVGLSLAPVAYQMWRIHPFHLSYYNLAVGGLPGACRAGFETTYWYDAVTEDVLERMNDPERGLPAGAILHPPSPSNNAPVFDELQALGKLRADIRLGAIPSSDFPYMHLLTHSAKSTVFTRILYSLTPLLERRCGDIRLFSVYPPQQVATAYALTLLCRATGEKKERLDEEIVRIAVEEPGALVETAVLLDEFGVEEAQTRAAQRRPAVQRVLEKLLGQKHDLERLLALRPSALEEAATLLGRVASRRPEVLRTIVEYPGYVPEVDLGGYLDRPALADQTRP